MLDGRVKTLHPKCTAASSPTVCCPSTRRPSKAPAFRSSTSSWSTSIRFVRPSPKPGCTLEDAIENIDIGGPTMVRAAAKNWEGVAIVVDSGDYAALADEMQANAGAVTQDAVRAREEGVYAHRRYDAAIGNYLTCRWLDGEPRLSRCADVAVDQGAGHALR